MSFQLMLKGAHRTGQPDNFAEHDKRGDLVCGHHLLVMECVVAFHDHGRIETGLDSLGHERPADGQHLDFATFDIADVT